MINGFPERTPIAYVRVDSAHFFKERFVVRLVCYGAIHNFISWYFQWGGDAVFYWKIWKEVRRKIFLRSAPLFVSPCPPYVILILGHSRRLWEQLWQSQYKNGTPSFVRIYQKRFWLVIASFCCCPSYLRAAISVCMYLFPCCWKMEQPIQRWWQIFGIRIFCIVWKSTGFCSLILIGSFAAWNVAFTCGGGSFAKAKITWNGIDLVRLKSLTSCAAVSEESFLVI